MTAIKPIKNSFYAEGRTFPQGAEIEIECLNPSRLQSMVDALKSKGWILREGVQPLLFSKRAAICLYKQSQKPVRSLKRAYNTLEDALNETPKVS
jgi:hypothetical protein